MNEAAEMVKFIVAGITGDKNCFTVEPSVDENGMLITLTVDHEFFGRVAGRKGNTINSVRQILRALGLKNQHRYRLKLEETLASE